MKHHMFLIRFFYLSYFNCYNYPTPQPQSTNEGNEVEEDLPDTIFPQDGLINAVQLADKKLLCYRKCQTATRRNIFSKRIKMFSGHSKKRVPRRQNNELADG